MVRRLALLTGLFVLTAAVCTANSTVSTARVMVPDGTSITDDFNAATTKWFVFQPDRGKSYLIEVLDTVDDQSTNSLSLAVFEGDGTTSLGDNESLFCNVEAIAPSLNGQAAPGSDGHRCAVYLLANNNPTPFVTIRVSKNSSIGGFKLRVRENDVIGRWSTNGYNMFVALQNATASLVSGFVFYYPSTATGVTGVFLDNFNIQPYGSVQLVHNSGTFSSERGLCRVALINGTDVNVQMYAFSPSANNFNVFTTEKPNHGGQNSW